MTLAQARKKRPTIAQLPFIKRAAFIDEDEYRAVFESTDKVLFKIDIPIPLSSIDKITLSPWLHKSLVAATKGAIHSIEGCEDLNVVKSTLVDNEEWKTIGGNAV